MTTGKMRLVRNNLTAIAVNLTQSLCDYFGIPLIEAGPVFRGTVVTDGSNLNLRQFPSTQGAIIGTIPNGACSRSTAVPTAGMWYPTRAGWAMPAANSLPS